MILRALEKYFIQITGSPSVVISDPDEAAATQAPGPKVVYLHDVSLKVFTQAVVKEFTDQIAVLNTTTTSSTHTSSSSSSSSVTTTSTVATPETGSKRKRSPSPKNG
eukprot:TRINITY_DN48538_c0_g1_i3.p3 TRINITY_DN48538_c0_g1~~TRINITY_DN48538_c0_g1_i3.p3  ORF type:complete len:107 (+),score=15.13 TRINITY_DN48538_c0_g1_i3:593-913(+)